MNVCLNTRNYRTGVGAKFTLGTEPDHHLSARRSC